MLVLRVFLDVEDDDGAVFFLFTSLQSIALGSAGLPLIGLLGAIGPADDGNAVADHKGGVEAHAELTDDIHILLRLVLLFKGKGTALGDGAQIVFQLFPGHAAAVVRQCQGALILIGNDVDGKLIPGYVRQLLGQRAAVQLVDRVAGVGDQLPQEDFLMGVNGVDHQDREAVWIRL